MPQQPLKNQIISWLKTCDYWFQYAGSILIESEKCTDELVNKTYELFKEDNGLKSIEEERDEIIFNEISDEVVAVEHLQLQLIKEIVNVNALAAGQSIPINAHLTIIYGANGTGKSGYVRLLNNAFISRGDKKILSNVFNDALAGDPSCKFTFQSTGASYDLHYPSQKDNPEFTRFSVFDSYCVRVHLEQDNKLNFTPCGFECFEKVLELYEKLRAKLYEEINLNKPANEFLLFFVNENQIRNSILYLSAFSNKEQLKELGTYTEEDAAMLAELIIKREKLKALNILKRIAELQNLLLQLREYMSRQHAILDCLKTTDILQYTNLINDFHKFRELATQEGIKSLYEYNIEELGSSEWKEFIKASKNYASLIETKSDDKQYPSDTDNCLFCLQPLADKEKALIISYWNLLKSEAEIELNRIIQTIREIIKKLKGLSPSKFDESTTLFEYVNSFDEVLAKQWKEIASLSEEVKQNIIVNLTNRNFDLEMVEFSFSIKELDSVVIRLQNAIEDLFQKNPAKELAELELQIQFLTDKSLLNKLLDKVLSFVAKHKWAEKAARSDSALNTRSVTIKQGELFTQYITDKYIETFNEECTKLNAPRIVDIIQRNVKVSALRKLQVAGVVANSVLSEGEQRAISLSDFLTEVQLNPNNKGVFFDDPVTSQDHQRREKIAERLIELASQKQVIVFTHDIAFFIRLKIIAEGTGLTFSTTTIRNAGGIPGIINPELPWIAQNVAARVKTLKDRLVKLKIIERDNSAEEYVIAAKSWYGLLREGWERAVEERLFKGVIERFSVGVQTQKLKKVVVTEDLLKEIDKGMTDSSNWLHDAAAGLNPTIPDTGKANSDLSYFNDFVTKCAAQ